ncbi:MAG: helix-turn-helix domain-containing protein [Polyangiaceae bacterium]|nr:helix-turn-helix domain-containing protein [Polyangiaceae bacterium]
MSSSLQGPRPAQGARLLALRRAAGLTQVELAKALGVSNANIAFWEWSAKPPRSDVLPCLGSRLARSCRRSSARAGCCSYTAQFQASAHLF